MPYSQASFWMCFASLVLRFAPHIIYHMETTMSDFLFDSNLFDKDHNIRIGVTRCDAHDSDVQINIRPGDKFSFSPTITLFLTCAKARDLGEALTAAADAEAEPDAEPDPDLLREIRDERLALLASTPSDENEHG